MPFVSALLVGVALAQTSPKVVVTVSTETFQGWQNCSRIDNGRFSIVVAPQIGRIVYAGFDRDARNLLWLSESLKGQAPNHGQPAYQNFGGDKIWVAPQSLWGWPPDPELDGTPFTVKTVEHGVVITSVPSKRFSVQVERTILLGAGGNVRIRNVLTNVGSAPVELGTWEVTQIDRPSMIAMTAKRSTQMPDGYYAFENQPIDNVYQRYDRLKEMLFIQRDPTRSRKYGAAGADGTIEATIGEDNKQVSFTVDSPYLDGQTYPDGGSAMEVYTNPDPDQYVEMELLSPVRKLQPKEKIVLPVRWQFKRIKA